MQDPCAANFRGENAVECECINFANRSSLHDPGRMDNALERRQIAAKSGEQFGHSIPIRHAGRADMNTSAIALQRLDGANLVVVVGTI